MINFKIVLNLLGLLLLVEGVFMLLCVPVAMYYHEPVSALVLSFLITSVAGFVIWLFTRKSKATFGRREGYLIVSMGWVLFSLFGSLPFLLSNAIPDVTNAFFETISGFTTTGASILNDIEALPKCILFWRSMTQWLGGMGIIVMSLAILPILGIGGMQLFFAEVPGPTKDKIHPRIKETAKRLWGIYIIFTMVEAFMLFMGGMNLFDAVCHSFTTMATGGYSTKQASIAYWDSPYIHYVITLFMFLAGTNFSLSYFALHLRFQKVFRNEEFKYYLGFVVGFTLLISLGLYFHEGLGPERSFRESIFQVVSIITTTGYVTADYMAWVPALTVLIFVLMFFGGSGGSTGGGPKIMRIMILLKNSTQELKRLIHPNAVIPVRIKKSAVEGEVVTNVLAFIALYGVIAIISMIIMSALGCDFETSIGSVAATLGNIGPGIGGVGPVENYADLGGVAKWFLSLLMLVGRLELFTVLILFSPAFWKN